MPYPLPSTQSSHTLRINLHQNDTSAPNAISLIGKLNTLGSSAALCNWKLEFLTSRPQTQSHLYVSAQHWSPPNAVCSAPSRSHRSLITAHPDIKRTHVRRRRTTPPSAVTLQTTMRVNIGRKSTTKEFLTCNSGFIVTQSSHEQFSIIEQIQDFQETGGRHKTHIQFTVCTNAPRDVLYRKQIQLYICPCCK